MQKLLGIRIPMLRSNGQVGNGFLIIPLDLFAIEIDFPELVRCIVISILGGYLEVSNCPENIFYLGFGEANLSGEICGVGILLSSGSFQIINRTSNGKQTIANKLNEEGVPRRHGVKTWYAFGIDYMLNNERYMGDALLQKKYTTDTLPFRRKENRGECPQYYVENANPTIVSRETYVSDCISKRVKANNGERNKYYIENNHPAIIDAGTFARVQEEIVRRSGKPKVKQKGTKTELSRYSSRYALSELLICGECRTPYRRCTWTAKGKRKIVWRCINRLDYGKKYCHHSPSIEESLLQDAVMRAIMQTAKQGNDGRLFGHGETGKGLYPNPTLRGERYLSKQKDTPYRNGRECFLCI